MFVETRPSVWQRYGAAAVVLALGLSGAVRLGMDRLVLPRPLPEAPQIVHRSGAPHTDAQGRLLQAYDPQRSFLPIALYHALDGRHGDRDFALEEVRQAGFNTVHVWEGQAMEAAVAAADRAGLQIVPHYPTPAQAAAFRDHPRILAWYLHEEPSLLVPKGGQDAALDEFAAQRAALKAVDPVHPVFALDAPPAPAGEAVWRRWADAGDVSAHWNYPVGLAPMTSLEGRRAVPASVLAAVDVTGGAKPVWLTVQAFGAVVRNWRMPSPAQLRAMVYAGVIHGATGVILFAYDSFVTRAGDVLGIAPAPAADYGSMPDIDRDGTPPLVVDDAALAASRDLWQEAVRINGELAVLAPAILGPTSADAYTVWLESPSLGRSPVRALLKDTAEGPVLMAVNLTDEPVRVRFAFARPVGGVARLLDPSPAPVLDGRGWAETFPPFGVQVYRLGEARHVAK